MNYIIKKIEKKVYTNSVKNKVLLNVLKNDNTYRLLFHFKEELFFYNVLDKKIIKNYLKESGIVK